MMVLICLIFSVLSTIDQYTAFANETLFYMVSLKIGTLISIQTYQRFSVKPAIGQNIAARALPTTRKAAFEICVLFYFSLTVGCSDGRSLCSSSIATRTFVCVR